MIKYLTQHALSKKISFHMPGHKGSGIYRMYGYDDFLEGIMDSDITEIPGADNLYQPEGIIKDVQDAYRELYEVKDSYLLVNGTTAGILASVMASVSPGKKLLMSRGCHKSVYNGVKLGNIEPVYLQPKSYKNYGIIGVITPEDVEKALSKDKNIEAVILPSPNYYGICSDIEKIAEIVHRYNKILIIDQAHGAHLKFFHKFGFGEGIPKSAEMCGADIVINSIHKTLASFTQSAVINVVSDRVDTQKLFEKLQLVQSTSPSYLLMASLAINAEILRKHGLELFNRWKNNLEWFYTEAETIQGLMIVKGQELDPTKINMDMSELGISGKNLEDILAERKIILELTTGHIAMAMTGIGNIKGDMMHLINALEDAAEKKGQMKERFLRKEFTIPKPGKVSSHGDEKEYVGISNAIGRVSAGNITPYPPGIPFVCDGEKISEEMVEAVNGLLREGHNVCGINEEEKICVYKRRKKKWIHTQS